MSEISGASEYIIGGAHANNEQKLTPGKNQPANGKNAQKYEDGEKNRNTAAAQEAAGDGKAPGDLAQAPGDLAKAPGDLAQAPGGGMAVTGNFSAKAPGGGMAVTGNFSAQAPGGGKAAGDGEAAAHSGGKIHSLIRAADGLSLGISMVVAVLIGVALGLGLRKLWPPLFWLGVALGVAAAVNNVYKAYRKLISMDDEAR